MIDSNMGNEMINDVVIFEFCLSFRRLATSWYYTTILADDITVHCSNIFSNFITNVTVK